ncbi:unnamed protein product [Rhodiola kirilowii]
MSLVVKKNSHCPGLLDRITELPDTLKQKILECLPLTDAVKTSMLSRNWRRIWTGMQSLVFDTPVVDSFGSLTEIRFTRIIERILLLHQGSLHRFAVVIPQRFDSKSLYLNGLFVILSRKEVQKLTIIKKNLINGEFLSIPSYFFECGGLTHLYLNSCVLRLPPSFQGFHNLVFLDLCSIDMESKELSKFISHCPNIETLILFDILEYYSEPLIISIKNVRVLHFEDFISGMIILENTPRLTVVTLECLEDVQVLHKKLYSMFELLCSLPEIEELTFDLPLLEPFNGDCPAILKKGFVALKTVTLGRVNICNRDDIMFLFCLLRSSPNLKMLHIYIKYIEHNNVEDELSVKYLEAEGIKGYNLSQLLNVKIAGLTGLRCETMLLNIMLSNCPILKTFHVELSSNIKIEKEAKMAWELNRCHRLSSNLELMYSNARSQV